MRSFIYRVSIVLCLACFFVPTQSLAGNCLVQGNKKIGDCSNVTVNYGDAPDLTVKGTRSLSGNYGRVIVKTHANAHISGNCEEVIVQPGANLHLYGNAGRVEVNGLAEISGNADQLTVNKGGKAVINGIVSAVSGKGEVVRNKGSIVNGKYIQ